MSNTIKAILIQEGEPSPNNPVEIKKLLVNEEAEKYINDLKKENKILRENAENNDKVVDKVNWEINILQNNRDKALKIIDSYDLGKYDYSIPAGGIIELREALKGDSDE